MLNTVTSSPRRTVPIRDVLIAAAAADRTGASAPGWRQRIGEILTDLAADGLIELPRTRFAGEPPLPEWVRRPPAAVVAKAPLEQVVWHEELSWVVELEERGDLLAADRQLLSRVNSWLPRRHNVSVPLRERSLDIFGDEKLLERVLTGTLIGRLTLDQLRTHLCWPPVEQVDLGSETWLVVENYTTFRSLGDRAAQTGFNGRVVWGSGTQVGARLAALASSAPRPHDCWYFGDIDAGGLRSARIAVERASVLGLPPVRPAAGLYRLLTDHGIRRPDKSRTSESAISWSADWLGDDIAGRAIPVLRENERIVQEHVGVELLSATIPSEWFVRSSVADWRGG